MVAISTGAMTGVTIRYLVRDNRAVNYGAGQYQDARCRNVQAIARSPRSAEPSYARLWPGTGRVEADSFTRRV